LHTKKQLQTTAEFREVFKKQTGGRGKFADMTFDLAPADVNVRGLQFVNEVKGGHIPKEYIRQLKKDSVKQWSMDP